MEARYLKEQLEIMLGGVEIFLDFDNLQDANACNSGPRPVQAPPG